MRRIVAGSLYAAVVVVLAAMAAWPIYRSSAFLVLVVVASALGAGVAALVTFGLLIYLTYALVRPERF